MSISITPELNETYIKPISSDEYKKQSSYYTQKSLLELKEQMKNFKPKHSNSIINSKPNNKTEPIIYDVDDDDKTDNDNVNNIHGVDGVDSIICDSESDYDLSDKEDNETSTKSNTNINLIIKNGKTDNKKHKFTSTNTSSKTSSKISAITNDIYKKIEDDNNKILNLNNKIIELKSLCNKMDKNLHYLKLDLINSQCDKDNLEKTLERYKQNNACLDNIVKYNNLQIIKNRQYYLYLKIFIIILLILNAYFNFFKYILLLIGILFLYFIKYIL